MFTEGPGAAGANGAASAEGGSASFEEVSGPAAAGGSESSGGGEQFGDGASDAPAGGGGSAAIDTAQGAGVGADGNLMPDPSFEVGISGWFFFGTSTVALASGIARTGDHALASSGRTQAFEGPAFDIEPLVQGGAVYDVALWVLADAGTHPFKLSLKATCRGQTDAEATYTTLDQLTAAASAGWSELAGSFTAPTRCPLAELFIYVEDPPPGVSFFVDDVSLFKALR